VTIAVLGPGGVGGFLAGTLARAGEDVLVVAREQTVATIASAGLQVRSVRIGDFTAHPAVAGELDAPVEVLLIATKATTLDQALGRVRAEPALVVPLLNGFEHVAKLRARFGADRVCAASIRIEADRPQPGVIVQTSPFLRVDLAHDDERVRPALERLVARLEAAEVPAQIGASEAGILWSKLVRLNALALTTSACDEPIGFIRTDPDWRAYLIGAIREAAAVAAAEGAEIDPAVPLGELDAAHPGLGSSMQRDIAAGRPCELDAIAGAVLRAAARHGIECPTIERLVSFVSYRVAAPRASDTVSEAADEAPQAATIEHLFMHVPVSDYDRGRSWYEQLLGRTADVLVHAAECMWQLAPSAWLVVVADPALQPGSAKVTALVDDLDAQLAELGRRGIATGPIELAPGRYRKIEIADPDGNRVAIAQALASTGADSTAGTTPTA
jgi:2-dehydropantoate 2-reductase